MARRNADAVPGSPQSVGPKTPTALIERLHPAALLLSTLAVGTGLALARHWTALALAAAGLGAVALHVEKRPLRGEVPLLGLAAIVFLAHTVAAGAGWRLALAPAAQVALRLLALLYLLRWAARSFLGRAARWLLGLTPPRRPRLLTNLLESARLTVSLLPLAVREAEQHALALRARGLLPGRGLAGRARYLAAWFLPFLGTMLRLSDAFSDALLARGYAFGAARRSGLSVSFRAPDGAILAGAALLGWGIARGF
jgi:energy-coupling factor transporter transmembrane protein EcfT